MELLFYICFLDVSIFSPKVIISSFFFFFYEFGNIWKELDLIQELWIRSNAAVVTLLRCSLVIAFVFLHRIILNWRDVLSRGRARHCLGIVKLLPFLLLRRRRLMETAYSQWQEARSSCFKLAKDTYNSHGIPVIFSYFQLIHNIKYVVLRRDNSQGLELDRFLLTSWKSCNWYQGKHFPPMDGCFCHHPLSTEPLTAGSYCDFPFPLT